jgi:hypothetical protein
VNRNNTELKTGKDVEQFTITCNNLSVGLSSSTILPTFTVKSEKGSVIRCLKDSGCTACFVKESVVIREKFESLKNINVNVNGVNSSQRYNTKICELKLNIGNSFVKIPAIVLPEIKTKLNIEGLGKIVTSFRDKGLMLADSYLTGDSDEINDIEIIMGSNYSHLLPENQTTFGKFNDSVYSNTSVGVLLMGDIDNMKRNLDYLPSVTVCQASISEDEDVQQRLAKLERSIGAVLVVQQQISQESVEPGPLHQAVSVNNEVLDFLECEANFGWTDINSFPEENYNELLYEKDFSSLDKTCNQILNIENCATDEDKFCEHNEALIDLTLDSIERDEEGRLIVPLLWNGKTAHLLGKNYNLASKILTSTKLKLSKNLEYFHLMDDVISEQLKLKVIERIPNLEAFKNSSNCSFMAHMPVFKMKRDTTKCRIVYLSNLTEKQNKGISHNTAMWSGPCLNRKLGSSVLQLRFDTKVLVFDLVRAFLQIAIPETDQQKLCFLWFKNVREENFEIVGYKFLRLP